MRAYFFVQRWSNVYSADQVNLPDALHAKLYGEETTVDLTKTVTKQSTQYISNHRLRDTAQGGRTGI